MTEQPTGRSNLQQQLTIHRIVIAVLFFTIIGGLILFFLYKPKPFIMAEVPEKVYGALDPATAQINLGHYRHKGAYASLSLYPSLKVSGILHDTTKFTNYITGDFKTFTKTHTAMKNCVWQVGIYPMVCKETARDPKKPRISFCFIPTMLDTLASSTEAGVKDYMAIVNDKVNFIYYIADSSRTKIKFDDRLKTGEQYIFDEGHLWP
jgi:hypothetical protein